MRNKSYPATLKVVDDVNPRIFETILANGTMHGLIGSSKHKRVFSSAVRCGCAKMLCSIYPRAVEAMGDVAGNEISSKIIQCSLNRLGRLVYEVCANLGDVKRIKNALEERMDGRRIWK